MESFARILIASTELIEAEGRALKRNIGRLFLALGLGIVALVMLLAGIGFVLFGLFTLLSQYVQIYGAALIFGGVALAAAVIAAVVARRMFV